MADDINDLLNSIEELTTKTDSLLNSNFNHSFSKLHNLPPVKEISESNGSSDHLAAVNKEGTSGAKTIYDVEPTEVVGARHRKASESLGSQGRFQNLSVDVTPDEVLGELENFMAAKPPVSRRKSTPTVHLSMAQKRALMFRGELAELDRSMPSQKTTEEFTNATGGEPNPLDSPPSSTPRKRTSGSSEQPSERVPRESTEGGRAMSVLSTTGVVPDPAEIEVTGAVKGLGGTAGRAARISHASMTSQGTAGSQPGGFGAVSEEGSVIVRPPRASTSMNDSRGSRVSTSSRASAGSRRERGSSILQDSRVSRLSSASRDSSSSPTDRRRVRLSMGTEGEEVEQQSRPRLQSQASDSSLANHVQAMLNRVNRKMSDAMSDASSVKGERRERHSFAADTGAGTDDEDGNDDASVALTDITSASGLVRRTPTRRLSQVSMMKASEGTPTIKFDPEGALNMGIRRAYNRINNLMRRDPGKISEDRLLKNWDYILRNDTVSSEQRVSLLRMTINIESNNPGTPRSIVPLTPNNRSLSVPALSHMSVS